MNGYKQSNHLKKYKVISFQLQIESQTQFKNLYEITNISIYKRRNTQSYRDRKEAEPCIREMILLLVEN